MGRPRSKPNASSLGKPVGDDNDVSNGSVRPKGSLCNTMDAYPGATETARRDLKQLEKHCPLATNAERMRFLNAKSGNYQLALEQLTSYLEFRETYQLDQLVTCTPTVVRDPPPTEEWSGTMWCPVLGRTPYTIPIVDTDLLSDDDDDASWHSCTSSYRTMDESDWKLASDKAFEFNDNSAYKSTPAVLPQLAQVLTLPDEFLYDREGHRILYLLPAQMDPRAASVDTFALCIAFYIDIKQDRESMEKITILIDVRGGRGWPNPRPNKLVPFIKRVSSILEKNYPERLSKILLFPLPRAATFLWEIIKKFLDPNTASKIAVIPGSAGESDPPPYKQMEAYMKREYVELMESNRVDTFS